MIRKILYRILKIPPRPHVPPGSGQPRIFRAGENFFTYIQLQWALAQLGALVGLLVAALALSQADMPPRVSRAVSLFELGAWLAFLVQIPFTYMMRRLDYELRWYIVTDRSLRIREGVTTIREKTMTFANLQNMTIRQGPIQRLLKIADVEVRTAGGGGGGSAKGKQDSPFHQDLHLAYFRGVDNAMEIRDLVRDRVRRQRDSGLGDPDEPHPEIRSETPDIAAARSLLREVQGLRAAFMDRKS